MFDEGTGGSGGGVADAAGAGADADVDVVVGKGGAGGATAVTAGTTPSSPGWLDMVSKLCVPRTHGQREQATSEGASGAVLHKQCKSSEVFHELTRCSAHCATVSVKTEQTRCWWWREEAKLVFARSTNGCFVLVVK